MITSTQVGSSVVCALDRVEGWGEGAGEVEGRRAGGRVVGSGRVDGG